jgi:hypothetical protein
MKKIIGLMGVLLFSVCVRAEEGGAPATEAAAPAAPATPPIPKVYSMKDAQVSGIYWAASGGGSKPGDVPAAPPRLVYVVDTKARLCYAQFTGEKQGTPAVAPVSIVPVSCQQLKNRPEWKDFISWGE